MKSETIKRSKLLALPCREWSNVSEYRSIIIVPSGKKHDSGYALMAIVGLNNNTPVEIAAYCDDINWTLAFSAYARLRTDMYYPSGLVHMWGNELMFRVGHSISSTDVFVFQQ